MTMKGWKLTIKEVGNAKPLETLNLNSDMTRNEVIEFYGCNEPDVEWYKIERIEL